MADTTTNIRTSVTAIIFLSRQWYLEDISDSYKKLDTSNIDMRLTIIVDDINIKKDDIEYYFEECNPKIFYTENEQIPEGNIPARRSRIAEIFNFARKYPTNTEYILTIEDDTIMPPDGLQKLLKLDNDGLRSGVQMGRHAIKMLGLWHIKPGQYQTLPYSTRIEKIDACGLYFCLIPKPIWDNTPFIYDADSPVGPDVLYGESLHEYTHLADMSVQCGHNIIRGILWPNESCQQITFTKQPEYWEPIVK